MISVSREIKETQKKSQKKKMQIRFQIEKSLKSAKTRGKKFISHQELTEQIKQFGMFENKGSTI